MQQNLFFTPGKCVTHTPPPWECGEVIWDSFAPPLAHPLSQPEGCLSGCQRGGGPTHEKPDDAPHLTDGPCLPRANDPPSGGTPPSEETALGEATGTLSDTSATSPVSVRLERTHPSWGCPEVSGASPTINRGLCSAGSGPPKSGPRWSPSVTTKSRSCYRLLVLTLLRLGDEIPIKLIKESYKTSEKPKLTIVCFYSSKNMKFLLVAVALVSVAVAVPTRSLVSPGVVGPASVLMPDFGPSPVIVDGVQPIQVGPAIVDQFQPIQVGPAIVDQFEPIQVGPAIVDQFQPIQVGPAIVDQFEPVQVGPAIVDQFEPAPAPSPAVVPTAPSASAPLVQIILNINQAQAEAPAPAPVPSPVPSPVIVDQVEEIQPSPVIVVDNAEEPIVPAPVIIGPPQLPTPIVPAPVIIPSPILPSPAIVLPDSIN
ncbi:hypothetical protein evm_010453 [Chilo suppressalis]|nr:hypothetical protein evm_010453 [Chilo suppressalis]